MKIAGIITAREGTLIFILMSVLVFTLTLEASIGKIFQIVSPTKQMLQGNIFLFSLGIFISLVGQFYLSYNVRKKILNLKRPRLAKYSNIILGFQGVLAILLCIVTAQIIISLSFNVILAATIFLISYALSLVNLSILLFRFGIWIRSSKNLLLLSNGISTSAILINLVISILYVGNGLLRQPQFIEWHAGPITAIPDPFLDILYRISSALAFGLTWVTSVIIFRNYSRKYGKKKFILISSLPIVYFLSIFQSSIVFMFSSYALYNPVMFSILSNLIFSISKTIGAILFAVGFWSVARSVEQQNIRAFMYMCSYGVMLLFVSNQANILLNYMFPPYGLVTISLIGLSSFLLLIGFYSTAVSVANDTRLRISIRRSVEQNLDLLGKIGTAEMELSLRRKILGITKDMKQELFEQTGIESSLSEEEVINYATIALREVKKARKANT